MLVTYAFLWCLSQSFENLSLIALVPLKEQLQCTSSSLVARTNIVCFISVAVYPLLPIIAPAVFLVLGQKTKEAPQGCLIKGWHRWGNISSLQARKLIKCSLSAQSHLGTYLPLASPLRWSSIGLLWVIGQERGRSWILRFPRFIFGRHLGHLALISCLYRFDARQDKFRPSQVALL